VQVGIPRDRAGRLFDLAFECFGLSFEFIAIHGMGSSVPGALTIFLSVLVVPGVPHTEHVNEPHDGEGKLCTVHACEDNGTPTASDSRRATLPSFVVETSAG
jgi:hypothetical protein